MVKSWELVGRKNIWLCRRWSTKRCRYDGDRIYWNVANTVN